MNVAVCYVWWSYVVCGLYSWGGFSYDVPLSTPLLLQNYTIIPYSQDRQTRFHFHREEEREREKVADVVVSSSSSFSPPFFSIECVVCSGFWHIFDTHLTKWVYRELKKEREREVDKKRFQWMNEEKIGTEMLAGVCGYINAWNVSWKKALNATPTNNKTPIYIHNCKYHIFFLHCGLCSSCGYTARSFFIISIIIYHRINKNNLWLAMVSAWMERAQTKKTVTSSCSKRQ